MEPFVHRDLSWLEFNARVLAQAEDGRVPLLERARFLDIFTSNLDEFFMKRVGLAHRTAGAGEPGLRAALRTRVLGLLERRAACFAGLRVELARAGIHLLSWKDLTRRPRQAALEWFHRDAFPVLTPLAVDPGHPFPLVSSLSTSLGLLLRGPEGADRPLFARVKVPSSLPSWVPVERADGEQAFVALHELVGESLPELFPGMEVVARMPFRVTRSVELQRDPDDVEDLLETVTEELRERRFAPVVRLEHGARPDERILRFLRSELELGADDVYAEPGEWIDYTTLRSIADLPRPALRWPPWVPVAPPAFADPELDVFAVIRARDVLVHHPYESFHASVLQFIEDAATDPRVLALKMTLYRTGRDSPFVPLLVRAAENGKQVVCLVELKARLDEARNIAVARELERAGVHVVYGLVGLKTHCKLALVVRAEADGVRSYAHVGTGNYHAQTANLYTDLGLFTCREELVGDVVRLFNHLTGRSVGQPYRRLLVAPETMKKEFLARIEREAVNASKGRPARIVAVMNQLEDRDLCLALCAASDAGVKIDLLVRGFCVLRPGLEGLTERVRVVSILGRFLEHSRVYHFANGHEDPLDGEFFLGSADWMRRNLEARIETVAPVEDRALKGRLWGILTTMLADRRLGWEMQPDGTYVQRTPADAEAESGSHAQFMAQARAGRGSASFDGFGAGIPSTTH